MQHLVDGPTSMPIPTPRTVLRNMPYLVGNQDLLDYVFVRLMIHYYIHYK